MSKHKRLFLFAAYDANGVINAALVYYLHALSRYGDIILCMDNKFDKRQIKKLTMHPLSVFITRHREYDFGSYKRAFQYAKKNDLLKNYDYVYLVNDSVFGPLFSPDKIITKMERVPKDAVGLITSKHRTHSFMESWFVRLNKKIFMSWWFDAFMESVKREANKSDITVKYEHGLTNLIQKHNCTWDGIYTVHGRATYNKPKYLFKHGMPFVKKVSFTRHNGALGRQIKYILNNTDLIAKQAIIKTMNQLYGDKYMEWFLTSNPIKIFIRNISYILKKLHKG